MAAKLWVMVDAEIQCFVLYIPELAYDQERLHMFAEGVVPQLQ